MRILTALLIAVSTSVAAHDGVVHKNPAEAKAHLEETRKIQPVARPPVTASPLPFDVGGPFELVTSAGTPRTEVDPDGKHQLLFFGYANCPSICAVALPIMGQAVDALAAEDIDLRPVMITIDPERDTQESIDAPLQSIHPAFSGLTGDLADLASAWAAFGIEREVAFVDPELGPIYAHGSHIFLLSPRGEVLTIVPPILDVERVAEIVRAYVLAAPLTQ
ncbi:SCO family protein [Roseovarius sp. CAU 1744]|uniref:SCO family protein n=1 Tax=Roseovarius sp. CAU 1744 TaxID=3140368 RepID=UPI00325B27EB